MPNFLIYKANIIRREEFKVTDEKTTIQSAWKMNIRAWKIWWKLCPSFFFSAGISSMVKALTPYVTIFLSAQIINELSDSDLYLTLRSIKQHFKALAQL